MPTNFRKYDRWSKATERNQDKKLKILRKKLAAPSTVKMEQQFYGVLPTAKPVKCHETGGAILFAQCIATSRKT